MGKKTMACILAVLVFFGGFGMGSRAAAAEAKPAGLYIMDTGAAERNGQEKEKPYWLLVVAVSFFIAVTTGVVVVLTYQKKVRGKPESADLTERAGTADGTPESGLVLKRIAEGDLRACADTLCAAYNKEPLPCRWEADTAEKYLRDYYEAKKFVGFALKIDGVLCGAVFCHEKIWRNSSGLFMDEIFVRPEYQRKGYGGMLLGEMKRYVEARGLAGFALIADCSAPETDFYRKNGFSAYDHILCMGLEIKKEK